MRPKLLVISQNPPPVIKKAGILTIHKGRGRRMVNMVNVTPLYRPLPLVKIPGYSPEAKA